METSIPKEKWGVHRNHCCKNHGCKYGYEDCPVVMNLIEQKYPCEECKSADFVIDDLIKKEHHYDTSKDWELPVDFEDTRKCNDWRNYAKSFEDIWNDLSIRERKIIYIYAATLANKEEWD